MEPKELRARLSPIRDELDEILGEIYWQAGMAQCFACIRTAVETIKLARDFSHRA